MAPEPSMLELLRSRLTDLEARQRATGGVAEHGFWERFAGRMPSAPSQPSAASAGSAFTAARDHAARTGRHEQAGRPGPGQAARLARAGATARPVAPATRAQVRPNGPWADLAPDRLESLDLDG